MKLLFRQSRTAFQVIVALMAFSATAHATIFSFNADPFAGTDALTTPGRQVVGDERFINFSIASDVFSFDRTAFGIQTIQFANDIVGNLPTEGVNVIVLQTFDNDNDPTTPFNAGIAANLIAEQVTSPAPGFFIYFNSGLDRARLVYSTDLSENISDLKIIARMQNLSGQAGRDAFPTFTAANFQVPEPGSSLSLVLSTGGLLGAGYVIRRRQARA